MRYEITFELADAKVAVMTAPSKLRDLSSIERSRINEANLRSKNGVRPRRSAEFEFQFFRFKIRTDFVEPLGRASEFRARAGATCGEDCEMAIFYLNVITVSRSVGRNAVVAATYCSRSRLRDPRREVVADFSALGDTEHSEILLAVGAQAEWSDRAILWNAVEAVEKRDDAQVAREVEIAIPSELSRADGIALAREFFNEQFVERGIIVDLNIHRASGADGVERSYVQGLFSMREIVAGDFGKKRTDWKDAKLLSKWRERWTLLSNKYLLAAGCSQLIRAGADAIRGRALEPLFENGETERRAENLEIAWRNGERLLGEPELALRALTSASATFSHREMIAFVTKNTAGKEQFDTTLARVECSVELVRLTRHWRR